ncbi:BPSL0761 family protein [Paraburkholderia sp. CNPSo 3076]|uniref:BPSL0761 family protein n=1 Tax=Paraburkholderia sp. CNPSo 3076 TaxID=2940936 RepID=UPI002B1D88AA|nr:BPSL0761 family protein [Paraburkholderia sp. CNPSo 3076]
MTTPYERTRTVVQTREFLEKLASGDAPVNHQKVQEEAIRLLRHYPLDFDLEISSTALPSVWASLPG